MSGSMHSPASSKFKRRASLDTTGTSRRGSLGKTHRSGTSTTNSNPGMEKGMVSNLISSATWCTKPSSCYNDLWLYQLFFSSVYSWSFFHSVDFLNKSSDLLAFLLVNPFNLDSYHIPYSQTTFIKTTFLSYYSIEQSHTVLSLHSFFLCFLPFFLSSHASLLFLFLFLFLLSVVPFNHHVSQGAREKCIWQFYPHSERVCTNHFDSIKFQLL